MRAVRPQAERQTAVRRPALARTRGELARSLAALRGRAGTLALVPTMGALHEGHRALIRTARQYADAVVVSVFVNPLQFGPGEDFERYPRDLPADLDLCAGEAADLVFAPETRSMYPRTPVATVTSGPLGRRYEGASRPGHFDGVLTVVAKLFHLVGPDVAVFGEKDFQQLALVRAMVNDLEFPVHVVGAPLVREADGLALSSRNRYLAPADRRRALTLSQALRAGAGRAGEGASAVRRAAAAELDSAAGVDVDYLALVDEGSFAGVDDGFAGAARLLVAARVGGVRLLDNVPVILGAGAPRRGKE
jgi:pantoate--beta-alanine ligase